MSDSILSPDIGDSVLCYLHNATILEGVVEEWEDNYIHLINKNKESIIIYFPLENVLFVKILSKQESFKQVEEVEQEFNEVIKQPASDLKNKKMAELKILLNEQEKEIITNRLKEQVIKDPTLPKDISQLDFLTRTTQKSPTFR